MVILTDTQAEIIRNALTAVVTGDPCHLSTLENCLEYLTSEHTIISCPMEQRLAEVLAQEMVDRASKTT
jgi:hypothetical protein